MSGNPGNGGVPKFGKMVPGGGGANGDPSVPPAPSATPPASPYASPPPSTVPPPPSTMPPPSTVPPPSAAANYGRASVDPLASPPPPTDGGLATTDPVLFTLGDIAVSRSWVITPNGTAPMRGSTWIGQDLSRTVNKTPTWAIVLAIVGFLACLLGLLFLMVKEDKTTGYFEVTVQSGAVRHVTQLPVSSAAQIAQYRQMVNQAQSIAAAA